MCPAKIDQKRQRRFRSSLCVHIARSVCKFIRASMFSTEDGAATVLELNTIPGMTEASLLPGCGRRGISYVDLCRRIIELARQVGAFSEMKLLNDAPSGAIGACPICAATPAAFIDVKVRSRRATQHHSKSSGCYLQTDVAGWALRSSLRWCTRRRKAFFRKCGLSVAHNRAPDGRHLAAQQI